MAWKTNRKTGGRFNDDVYDKPFHENGYSYIDDKAGIGKVKEFVSDKEMYEYQDEQKDSNIKYNKEQATIRNEEEQLRDNYKQNNSRNNNIGKWYKHNDEWYTIEGNISTEGKYFGKILKDKQGVLYVLNEYNEKRLYSDITDMNIFLKGRK